MAWHCMLRCCMGLIIFLLMGFTNQTCRCVHKVCLNSVSKQITLIHVFETTHDDAKEIAVPEDSLLVESTDIKRQGQRKGDGSMRGVRLQKKFGCHLMKFELSSNAHNIHTHWSCGTHQRKAPRGDNLLGYSDAY